MFSEYEVTVEPSGLIFDVDDINAHLKTSFATLSDYMTMIIKSVTQFAEIFTKRDFLNRTYKNYRNEWATEYELRRSKFSSITNIKYLDTSDAEQTVNSSYYYNTFSNRYSKVVFKEDMDYPELSDLEQAIRITFVSGFGATGANVPQSLSIAMLNHIARVYAQRGDCTDVKALGSDANLPVESKMQYGAWEIKDITI